MAKPENRKVKLFYKDDNGKIKSFYQKKLKAGEKEVKVDILKNIIPDGGPKEPYTTLTINVGGDEINVPSDIYIRDEFQFKTDSQAKIQGYIKDVNNSLVSIEWTQTSGTSVVFTNENDDQTMVFTTPPDPAKLKFHIKATDLEGLSVEKDISVVVKKDVEPEPNGNLVRFLSLGDNDTTEGSKLVYQMMKQIPDVDRIIHVGDLPYKDDPNEWMDENSSFWTPEEVEKIWRVSKGNHDTDSDEEKETQWGLEQYFKRYLRNTYKQHVGEGYIDNIRRNLWTEVEQVGNVLYVNMDTEDRDILFERDQYTWMKNEVVPLAQRLRVEGKIDWVVVSCHRPFFVLKSNHHPGVLVRFVYKDLFSEMQVDVVLHGHNHNTQLWLPMLPNDSKATGEGHQLFEYLPDGKTFDFTKLHGWLTVINGHGGHGWKSINDSVSGVDNVMHYRDSGTFGFTKLDPSNSSVIYLDRTSLPHFVVD